MVVVASVEYLVVGLTVVGREHQAEEWGRSFVVQDYGEVGTGTGVHGYATGMAGTSYGIVEAYGWLYVQGQAGIGWIVAIACVVYKSDVCGGCSAGKQTQCQRYIVHLCISE